MTDDTENPAERVSASWRSETGRVRAVNEDSLLARYPVWLVADGMGGHERGDRASRTAIDVLDRMLPTDGPADPAAVLAAVSAANEAIRELRTDEPGALSGTTLTGIVLARLGSGELRWMVINVGDSRVYGWNGRRLEQLTTDHSVVQELVDAGEITRVQAEQHPDRNTITRALGAFEQVDVDAWLLPRSGPQTFVICSDGITKELDTVRMEAILSGYSGAGASLADALVEAALSAGGRDNVTAIVLESSGEPGEVVHVSTGRRDRVLELDDTLPRGPR